MNKKNKNKIKEDFSKLKAPPVEIIKNNIDFSHLTSKKEEVVYKKKINLKFAYSLIAILILVPTLFLLLFNQNSSSEIYYLYIDINPSIELTVNEDDLVVTQRALNEDAVLVLLEEDFIGKEISYTTNQIVLITHQLGFLNENDIKISTIYNDSVKEQEKDQEILNKLNSFLESNSLKSNIIVPNTNSLAASAKEYGISTGKMQLVIECNEKTNIPIEDLVDETITKLKEMIVEYNQEKINQKQEEFKKAFLNEFTIKQENINKINLIVEELKLLKEKVNEVNPNQKEIESMINTINLKLTLEDNINYEFSTQEINKQITNVITKYNQNLNQAEKDLNDFKLTFKIGKK